MIALECPKSPHPSVSKSQSSVGCQRKNSPLGMDGFPGKLASCHYFSSFFFNLADFSSAYKIVGYDLIVQHRCSIAFLFLLALIWKFRGRQRGRFLFCLTG
jgi:hypothetical protein